MVLQEFLKIISCSSQVCSWFYSLSWKYEITL
jgi:hypothetical protein